MAAVVCERPRDHGSRGGKERRGTDGAPMGEGEGGPE
jgi:hypothetical protein